MSRKIQTLAIHHRLRSRQENIASHTGATPVGEVLARIKRLVYATADPRSGAAGSVFNILQSGQLNHRVELASGILEQEAALLLQTFFRERR